MDGTNKLLTPSSKQPYLTLAAPLVTSKNKNLLLSLAPSSHTAISGRSPPSFQWGEEDIETADGQTLRSGVGRERGDGIACANDCFEWTIHIVYSATWRVPVLYFTVRHFDDGRPVSWEEIHELLSFDLGEVRKGRPVGEWPILTQEFHPGTAEPCFVLHPCHTAKRMSHILGIAAAPTEKTPSKAPYIMSWFSMVAPTVGIHVPPEIFVDLAKAKAKSLHSAAGSAIVGHNAKDEAKLSGC